MRRLMTVSCSSLLVLALLFATLIPLAHAENAEEQGTPEAVETYVDPYGLNISAECAILVDASSGRVLYEKNAEQHHLIASITKIMTALVVLEKAEDLDATVTIPEDWMGVEGSSMYLEAGDVAVSYTHLDVYKRQVLYQQPRRLRHCRHGHLRHDAVHQV